MTEDPSPTTEPAPPADDPNGQPRRSASERRAPDTADRAEAEQEHQLETGEESPT